MGKARHPTTASPLSPDHSAPRQPTGQIPEEPTEAHQPRASRTLTITLLCTAGSWLGGRNRQKSKKNKHAGTSTGQSTASSTFPPFSWPLCTRPLFLKMAWSLALLVHVAQGNVPRWYNQMHGAIPTVAELLVLVRLGLVRGSVRTRRARAPPPLLALRSVVLEPDWSRNRQGFLMFITLKYGKSTHRDRPVFLLVVRAPPAL